MKKLLVCSALIAGVLVAFANSNSRTADTNIGVAVSPQKLLLGTVQSGSVVVHTTIPLSTVATSTLALNGLPVVSAYADSLGHLVATFNEADVKTMVSPPSATLTLTGSELDGTSFAGSDVVAVEVYRKR